MLGVSAALLSGANATAPLVGGWIFQVVGAPAPFFLGALLLTVLLGLSLANIKAGREESAPAAGLGRASGSH
jgi:uncharacterized membrane protein AbrB (regulator of aidB expression)